MSEKSSICQSCAMPLVSRDDFGTEKNGSPSSLYCKYCYQDGEFTDKTCTSEQIAEQGAAVMSQMYGMPIEKARIFMSGQVQTLKRWSGRIVPTCQSCGMPLFSPEDFGTEKDGTPGSTYCIHCYQNGTFTEPDLTHEEMIKKGTPFLVEQFGVQPEKAEEMIRVFTSNLSRWK